ncbi:DUF5959 family protein [Streptomyces sp. NBC_01218]|uniref:DUF5959 family protein n=1 Tax=Streptomyces sp. NBC_01218 TaxID=2903780 RepID=UPI002E11AEA8|nr:DUF5959 family protein [Streptomyces sp. NBC_01218]
MSIKVTKEQPTASSAPWRSFVDIRLELYLLPHDLDQWQRQLSHLAPGAGATLGGDRGPSLTLGLYENGWLSIEVRDPDRLNALLGLAPAGNWVDEHHDRLQRVRPAWPREVVETPRGTYAWSPDRER